MSIRIEKSIQCDNCEEELIVDSPYPAKYVLELKSVDVGINTSGATFAVCVHPAIKDTMHFCGFICLENWIADRKSLR